MDVLGLTEEEIAVAKLAGQFFLAFKELPQAHPSRRKCWRTFGGTG